MNTNLSEKEALLRLQYLCSKAERCPKDIADKLKSWKYEGDTTGIIQMLVDDGFINESRYVRAFVSDKIKLAAWGRNKIKFHLRSKGIAAGIIEEILQETNIEKYEAIVWKELERKNKTITEENFFKRKQKLFAFALQRGYESDIVNSIIEKIIGPGD